MNSFEDRLFADLMREHGNELAAVHRPAVARRGTARLVAVAAGAVGLAGAVALGANTIGTGSPAYAVTRDPDGRITVSLRDVSGIKGANAKLRKLGIRAVAVPMTRDCTAHRTVNWDSALAMGEGGNSGNGFSFAPDSIPAGRTAVLAAQVSDGKVLFGWLMVRGPVPECLPEDPLRKG